MGHEPRAAAPAPHVLEAGELSPDIARLVVRHLPVQVSVIDEHGVLLYWFGELFDGCDPAYIGRPIEECHLPASVEMIERMTEAFRDGSRDEAVFYRYEGDRLVLARYVPLRDSDGSYRGMLETMQDVTDMRQVSGEQRQLDW